jgi:F-type H+-transporting ATPase subunit b
MLEFNIEFWSTFGFTILNILILFFVLKKVLFGRLTSFMESRANKIEETLENAEETKRMIEEMKNEYDVKLKAMRLEGQKMAAEYKEMGLKEYNNIVNEAKKNAEKIIVDTRAELEVEKQQVMASIRSEITGLVISASEKLIKENMNTDVNQKLVKEFIDSEYIA